MRTNFSTAIRALAAALALGFASVPAAEASSWWSARSEAVASKPRRETLWGVPRDDPAIAVGAIVGGIALLIFFAWIASRIGDKN